MGIIPDVTPPCSCHFLKNHHHSGWWCNYPALEPAGCRLPSTCIKAQLKKSRSEYHTWNMLLFWQKWPVTGLTYFRGVYRGQTFILQNEEKLNSTLLYSYFFLIKNEGREKWKCFQFHTLSYEKYFNIIFRVLMYIPCWLTKTGLKLKN